MRSNTGFRRTQMLVMKLIRLTIEMGSDRYLLLTWARRRCHMLNTDTPAGRTPFKNACNLTFPDTTTVLLCTNQ